MTEQRFVPGQMVRHLVHQGIGVVTDERPGRVSVKFPGRRKVVTVHAGNLIAERAGTEPREPEDVR